MPNRRRAGGAGADPWISGSPAVGAVVLGMGRSGTSAVSGMLVASGFDPGPVDDLLEANDANPRGYFESRSIIAINEIVLAELGASWRLPPTEAQLEAIREDREAELVDALDRLVAQSGGRPLLLKDPRIGVLLPLWRPVLAGVLHPVLALRDPLEVALSLRRRDGTPVPFGLAAWELHLTTILPCLDGAVITVAPYAGLKAPGVARAVVAGARAALGDGPAASVNPGEAPPAIDPALHRNHAGPHDHRAFMTPRQLELWAWLARLPAGAQRLRVPARLLGAGGDPRDLVMAEEERLKTCEQLGVARAASAALAQERDELARQRDQLAQDRAELGALA